MLDVCWDLSSFETSRWLELKPDRANVTRSGTGSITVARTQRQTEHIAMIEAGNESQLSAQLLLLSNDAVVVSCTEVLFQPSFLLVVFNMLSAEHETVAVWCGRTEHAAYHETGHGTV